MWIYDPATLQVLDANDAALHRYGYSHDDFLTLRLTDLRPAEDRAKFLELVLDSPPGDRTGPWRHELRDGTQIQVLVTSHSVMFGEREARLVMAEILTEENESEIWGSDD